MSAKDPKVTTGAAYEAHARTADGAHVEVLLDKSFKVLVTRTMPPGGAERDGAPGPVS